MSNMETLLKPQWKFPDGPIVKTSQASTAKDVDLIPGQGIKIPQAGLWCINDLNNCINKRKIRSNKPPCFCHMSRKPLDLFHIGVIHTNLPQLLCIYA